MTYFAENQQLHHELIEYAGIVVAIVDGQIIIHHQVHAVSTLMGQLIVQVQMLTFQQDPLHSLLNLNSTTLNQSQ